MTTSKTIAAGLSILLLMTGCQPGDPNAPMNKQGVGTILGAIGGAVVGNKIGKGSGRVVGIAAGTLLGAALGNSIGSSLDRADMEYYNSTSQRALETAQPGQTLPWKGQNASGTVTPSNYYQNSNGDYCREYTQKIIVGGKTQEGHGTACRQPDGSWKIVE